MGMEVESIRKDVTIPLYNAFKFNHDTAYEILQTALSLDEQGDFIEALNMYKDGLVALGNTFALDIEKIVDHSKRDKVKEMVNKMKISRSETLARIHHLDKIVSPYASLPPEYEAIMVNSEKNEGASVSEDYYDHEGKYRPKPKIAKGLPNAECLLDIKDGVQLFFIDAQNIVTSPNEACGLKIFKIDENNYNVVKDVSQVQDQEVESDNKGTNNVDVTLKPTNSGLGQSGDREGEKGPSEVMRSHELSKKAGSVPPAVLHVGSWIYPLFPNQSPILKDLIGAYMFPDLTDSSGKSFVGVILSSKIDPGLRHQLERLFKDLALFKKMDPTLYNTDKKKDGRSGSSVTPSEDGYKTPLEDLIVSQTEHTDIRPATRNVEELKRMGVTSGVIAHGEGEIYPRPPGLQKTMTERWKPARPLYPPPGLGGTPAQPADLGGRICQNIVYGTDWVAQNIQYITEKADCLIRENAQRIQENIQPVTEPLEVGRLYRATAYVARRASNYAVRVTQYSVKKFSNMAVSLAHYLGPVVKRSTVLIPQAVVSREKADHALEQILDVAEQSIIGISTIFLSLEMAGIALASSLSDETVRIVEYKYGRRVGSLTHDALVTATNLAKTGYNLNSFGPKALMLNTARKSGVAFVESIRGHEHLVQERQAKEKAIRDHFEKQRMIREARKAEDIITP